MIDSLKKRYFFKLSTNLIGLGISLVTQAIIPRGLGPKSYGDFSFLSNFFTGFVSFLDMGTSIGFYTKLSQKPQEASLVSFYLSFSVLVSLAAFGFVIFAQISSVYHLLWPQQQLFHIYLAALWGILTWFMQILIKMADAYGLTVSTEIARMLQKLLGLALIVMLFSLHKLYLTTFFLYYYVIIGFLIIAFIWIMKGKGYSLRNGWDFSVPQVRTYIKDFYDYSHPLFVYALVVFVVTIFDRWILQVFGGSVQQGFFGLSYQIGALCFVFTSAMTPLLLREFSIAFEKKDLAQIAYLFRRYIPILYSIAGYFSCFIAVQAKKAIYFMGGQNYNAALPAVTLMAFYPIHQTYGQLSGSVFFACGQTRLYRNIGIIFMLLGLPATYFLIAPHDKFGLDAGATGLAIKMAFIQFLGVNVQLYFNSRLLGLPFWHYVGHQLVSIACMLAVAFLVMIGVDQVLLSHDKIVQGFFLAGFIYTVVILVLAYFAPIIFGLKKQDVNLLKNYLRKCLGYYNDNSSSP